MSETVIFPSGLSGNIAETALRSLTFRRVRAHRAVLVNPQLQNEWYSQPSPILSYATQGAGDVYLDYRKTPYRIKEGMCVYIPAGMVRRSFRKPYKGTLIREFSFFELQIFGGIPLLPFFETPRLFTGQDAQGLLAIIRVLIAEEEHPPSSPTFSGSLAGYGLVFDLLRILLKKARPTAQWAQFLTQHERLRPVLDYISTHLDSPLTIEDLCDISAMSASTLTRAFRAAFGKTPLAYLRGQRMERAQHLLLTTDAPLAAVAVEVGYSDPFGFSKSFTRHSGIAPSRYREAAQHLL